MQTPPRRFYSLDALRGIAALSVVVFHWHLFFYSGTTPGSPLIRPPLFDSLFVLYAAGSYAVNLFFALSGFIFYWQYADAVSERRVGGSEFFVLRFSRLYPLHLATLLAVATGQWLHVRLTGSAFVFAQNDFTHFALQLALASNWGFEQGKSFNGPIWSVSIEVLLYTLFFILCRLRAPRVATAVAFAAVGLFGTGVLPEELSRALCSFFIGGAIYTLYRALTARGVGGGLVGGVVLLAVAAWVGAIAGIANFIWRAPSASFWPNARLYSILLLFPLTILALALAETWRGTLGRRLSLLGDISYASYLLHFPLQLWIVVTLTTLGVGRAAFVEPWALFAFLTALLALSTLSYRAFERPVQNLIRRHLLRSRNKGGGET